MINNFLSFSDHFYYLIYFSLFNLIFQNPQYEGLRKMTWLGKINFIKEFSIWLEGLSRASVPNTNSFCTVSLHQRGLDRAEASRTFQDFKVFTMKSFFDGIFSQSWHDFKKSDNCRVCWQVAIIEKETKLCIRHATDAWLKYPWFTLNVWQQTMQCGDISTGWN